MAKKDNLSAVLNDGYWGQRAENGDFLRDEDGYILQVNEKGQTPSEALQEYQDKANRLNAISGVYQRADRIITGESDMTVSVVSDPLMEDVADNTGKEIRLNANLIENLTEDSIISLHGVNYHELGHLLFSPRAGSDLGRFVKDNEVIKVMNMLEEARTEQLLISKYPATQTFLEANSMQYVLSQDPEMWGDQFLSVTGRTYLPLELRQHVADKFIESYGAEVAKTIHSIVHEYRNLTFPTDFDRAKELITELSKLVGKDSTPPEGGAPQWTPKGHGNVLTKGRPEGGNAQKKLQDGVADNGSEELEEKAKGNEHQPAYGEGGADDTKIDVEQRVYTDEDKVMADLLTKRLNEIKQTPFVKREVKDTRRAITNSSAVKTELRKATITERAVSPSSRIAYKRFAQELERLVRDNDPNWERRVRSGKLNIRRTMTPDVNAVNEMFDVWNTGNPNTDIEAVVLTDISGSMGWDISAVNEGSWIIKRAVESIEGSVSVFAFNHESFMVYGREDKTKPNVYRSVSSGGNTNPIRGLVEAERILTTSKKSVKMLFVLTDGTWADTKSNDTLIQSMNDKGILTCVVFIGDQFYRDRFKEWLLEAQKGNQNCIDNLRTVRHGAKIFKAITKPSEMVELAKVIVKEAIGGARR